MNPNDPQGYFGLPNAAFQDTGGDKDAKVSGIDGYEVAKEVGLSFNINMVALYAGWLLKIAGNAIGYNVLLFIVFSIGLGFLMWALYRFFLGKGNKPKITWRLFNWGIGALLSLLVHYVF